MPWLFPAVFSYAFFAVSSVADRALLAGPLPHPAAYAFSAGITGIAAFLLVPFGFRVPDAPILLLALGTGALNILALGIYFRAIQRSNVSRIVPMTGALTPIATVTLVAIALRNEAASLPSVAALASLIAGTVLLSIRTGRNATKVSSGDLGNAALAAILFSSVALLMKMVYVSERFVNGLIWMAFGGFLASLALLAIPSMRRIALRGRTWRPKNVWLPIVVGKTAGGAGALLQQYAIFLARFGELAFIQALQGIQYAFLLALAALLSWRNPKLLREELTVRSLPLRLLGITAIGIGLAIAVR